MKTLRIFAILIVFISTFFVFQAEPNIATASHGRCICNEVGFETTTENSASCTIFCQDHAGVKSFQSITHGTGTPCSPVGATHGCAPVLQNCPASQICTEDGWGTCQDIADQCPDPKDPCLRDTGRPTGCGCTSTSQCIVGALCDPTGKCSTPTDSRCTLPTGRPLGCVCSNPNQCATNNCKDEKCAPMDSCSEPSGRPNGCQCTTPNQCQSNVCNSNNLCGSSIPTEDNSGGIVPCGTQKDANGIITNPCNLCHLYTGAKNIIDFMLLDLILPLAVIAFLIGGIFMLASAGNPQMLQTGKTAITNTIIGVIIAFASWLIIATIVNTLGYKGFTAAWNEPPTCKESIAGTAPPPPPPYTVKKFCVRSSPPPGVPACQDKGSEEACTNKGCTDGTCQTSCTAVKKFCVSLPKEPKKTCFDRGSEERCKDTCKVGTCEASCPAPGGFTPTCSANSDSVEVATIRTCVTLKAIAAKLSIDNITTYQGNHSCNPPSSVSCHYGGTQPPPCNGTAHAIDFSLTPKDSNAANWKQLFNIASTCPGVRNVFCESGTQRFSTCTNSSINHIHVNDATSASCGCN